MPCRSCALEAGQCHGAHISRVLLEKKKKKQPDKITPFLCTQKPLRLHNPPLHRLNLDLPPLRVGTLVEERIHGRSPSWPPSLRTKLGLRSYPKTNPPAKPTRFSTSPPQGPGQFAAENLTIGISSQKRKNKSNCPSPILAVSFSLGPRSWHNK
jgi:hypothetical protein